MGPRLPSKAGSLRGRPGTKALPLADGRAVGGPIAFDLLASYLGAALAGWAAGAVSLFVAAPELALGDPLSTRVVLAVHLVALGFLPLAVTGASFHLLPVLLRNDVRHPRRLQLALPLLLGGLLVAVGIALDNSAALWPGASLLTVGFVLVLSEILGLVLHAPGHRTLVVSRVGVALSSASAAAALVLGAVVFSQGDEPVAGVDHARWLLVHLNLAVIGWLTVLIVTVGRTLAPMLALAPTPPPRRFPMSEVLLTAGLWTLLAGIAARSDRAVAVGGLLILVTLGHFAVATARVARGRRMTIEAPLVHMLAGVAFLVQAAVVGLAVLEGALAARTGLTAYVVFLLLGWAAGVTLGHTGKLLSLSLWVWWPRGPRPKQVALYPRRAWLAEAAAFVSGVELVGVGTLAGSIDVVRLGGAVLVGAAALAGSAALWTWRRRPRGARV